MAHAPADIKPATTHPLAVPELVLDTMPEDERLWVPMKDSIWFRPLLFNTT